eukprot:TRINITY_DN37151_c0_g1_i1.p1 TRINITY_DN37151_c0_g1~~TRINITY_DN37151_c0_g1_i1.p1  ORF type:complete len:718 (+),score=155.64 TRINITY_DN37151_c0_g1_i1:46-2154(+)
MGRAGKKRGRERGGRGGNNKSGDNSKDVWKYEMMGEKDMVCEPLDRYYKMQTEVIKDEAEWEEILQAFRKPLPITFRVNDSNDDDARKTTAAIREIQSKMREDGVPEDKMLKEVEWFPGEGMCWEVKMTKKELSREIKGARPLHEFLIAQTESGKISRQEVVSMIPPLFLDVKPDHLVLDTCAAPGSKTAQIMESLAKHKGEVTGCVIANDMDTKRCEVLVRQTQRLRELYPNVIITNHNASLFPSPVVPAPPQGNETRPRLRKLSFDRILNDVVCSGDGTFRKSLDLWGRWTPAMGLNTHKAQCLILSRSMDLLKEGGRLVYSTCSLNPVEDEAVLNHCLKNTKHEFELVDCSKMLPSLQRSEGVNTWKITSRDGKTVWNSFADIPEDEVKKYHYTPSLFPSDDIEKYNMKYSMRFKPHQQDTGGFFVAVLYKKKEGGHIHAEPKPADEGKSWKDAVKDGDVKGKPLEFSLFQLNETEQAAVREGLGVNEKFPTSDLFCRRTGDRVRRAFLFAPLASSIIQGSNLRYCGDGWPRLKLVAGGLRVGERYKNECFRSCQEATPFLSLYAVDATHACVPREMFVSLVSSLSHPWVHNLPEGDPLITSLNDGSCIFTLEEDPPQTNPRRIVAAAVRKTGQRLHLWADGGEVDKIRVSLGLPIPEKPSKKKEEPVEKEKDAPVAEEQASQQQKENEESEAKKQKTE